MNHIVSDFYDDCFEAQATANYEREMQHKREALDEFLQVLFNRDCILTTKVIEEVAEELKEKWQ